MSTIASTNLRPTPVRRLAAATDIRTISAESARDEHRSVCVRRSLVVQIAVQRRIYRSPVFAQARQDQRTSRRLLLRTEHMNVEIR